MSDRTKIEWTRSDDGTPGATWNPVTGCTKVSAGCDHCYAETIAHRFAGTKAYPNGFDVTLRPDKLDQPLRWRRPRRIFVNSMSDLFHAAVPDEYIAKVWGVMAWSPRHTYQILTKRHARMRSLLASREFKSLVDDAWYEFGRRAGHHPGDVAHPYDRWPLPNVWLGVSTENQQWADIRIPALLATPAAVRFISAEPLLGPIDLTPCYCRGGQTSGCARHNFGSLTDVQREARALHFPDIDWVIVGGESGPGARPMHPDWARTLRDQCTAAGVPFLFKQWGEYRPSQRGVRGYSTDRDRFVFLDGSGHMALRDMAESMSGPSFGTTVKRVGKKQAGRVLDGRTWDEYPGTTAVTA